eukprot:Skav201292  [mRNA]  locus=scaffold37:124161:124745:+ [translate_table: standard]
MLRPSKKTNVPAVIFGFAILATIATASYAVMSRSIDKERMFRGVIFDIERMKQKAQARMSSLYSAARCFCVPGGQPGRVDYSVLLDVRLC